MSIPLRVSLLLVGLRVASGSYGTSWTGPKERVEGRGPLSHSLQNASNLIGKCFDFPTADFDAANSIKAFYPNDPTPLLDRGAFAIDFALPGLDDKVYRLQDLLKTKPVVLIYGARTCPAFQGYYLEDHQESHFSKYDQWALTEKYHEEFHFVNLYSVEPHPLAPDKNFDTGENIEFEWSTFRQPRTYRDRAYFARDLVADLHEETLLLIDNLGNTKLDELDGIPAYNPVWCTYGPGSRMAFLIGQDGKLYNVQGWFHSTTMAGAMEEHKLLSAVRDLRRQKESSLKLEALAERRDMAYAEMERGLHEALRKMGAAGVYDYQPSRRSREVLRAEATGRIDEVAADYDAVRGSLLDHGVPESEEPYAAFDEQHEVLSVGSSVVPHLHELRVMVTGSGAALGAVALFAAAAAVAVLRRRRARRRAGGPYIEIPEVEDEGGPSGRWL